MAINAADLRQFFIGHPSAVGVGVHRSSAVVSATWLSDTHRAVQQAVSRLAGPATAGQPAGSHRIGTGNDYERHGQRQITCWPRGGARRFEAIAQELGTDPVEREPGSRGGRPIGSARPGASCKDATRCRQSCLTYSRAGRRTLGRGVHRRGRQVSGPARALSPGGPSLQGPPVSRQHTATKT